MNHKWKDNTCIHCGITRERKEYKRVTRTYSKLGRDGVFYDVPVYEYGAAWWYGKEHKFKRPECKKQNDGTE
jgi:hypothetical protein